MRGTGEQLHQFVLRAVGVLVFVDQEVSETPVIAFADFGGDLEQAHGFQQQIVEVQRIGLEQLLAIDLEDVRDLLFHGIGRGEEVLLRIDHVILRPRDPAQRHARLQLLVVHGQPLERGLDHGLLVGLVVNGEVAGEALAIYPQSFDVAPQHAHAEAVESGEQRLGERAVAKDAVDALRHLGGRFIGERHG